MDNIIMNDFSTFQYLYHYLVHDHYFTKQLKYIAELFGFRKNVYVKIIASKSDLEILVKRPLPDWVKGVAINPYILIVNPSSWGDENERFTELFLHEYIHLAINNVFRVLCPTWLNEGLAMYFSEQYKSMMFCDLDMNYNFYNEDQEVDYNQCANVTLKLIETYGEKVVLERAISCTSFYDDEILGDHNLKKLLRRYKDEAVI